MNKEVQFSALAASLRHATPQHFIRLLKSEYGYIKFYFNQIYTVEGVQYHISCMGPNRKVYNMQMAEILRQWHFTPACKCPLWIKEMELSFEKAILDSMDR